MVLALDVFFRCPRICPDAVCPAFDRTSSPEVAAVPARVRGHEEVADSSFFLDLVQTHRELLPLRVAVLITVATERLVEHLVARIHDDHIDLAFPYYLHDVSGETVVHERESFTSQV